MAARVGRWRRLASSALSGDVIPRVDVASLIRAPAGSSDPSRLAALDALRAATVEWPGFFIASVPTGVVPPAQIEAAYTLSNRFFCDLPSDVKHKYNVAKDPALGRGWTPPGAEAAYEAGTTSLVEAFELGHDHPPGGTNGDPNMGPNVWPHAELPQLAPCLNKLYARLSVVSHALHVALAEALRLPPDTFAKHAGVDARATMRVLRYAPGAVPHEPDALGISAHTDFECFTLIHQSAPGLQLRARAPAARDAADARSAASAGDGGPWIDAPPTSRGELIVLVGDMLERWTNGTLVATPHRVPPLPHERMSIVRFNGVTSDTRVAPLPAFGTARYDACTMGEHMDRVYDRIGAGVGATGSAKLGHAPPSDARGQHHDASSS